MPQNDQASQQFINAANEGNLQEMMRAKDAGADVNFKGGEALLNAAARGHEKCVEFILDHGGDIHINTRQGSSATTPLMSAAYSGHILVVRVLLERGADPTIIGGIGSMSHRVAHEWPRQNTNMNDYVRSQIINAIEDVMNGWVQPQVDDAISKKTDCVVVSRTLGTRVLQEHFNFKAMERLTLFRKGQNGPVESTERRDFATIADKGALRAAFEKYQAMGGACDEFAVAEILGRQISKKAPKVSIVPDGAGSAAPVGG